MSSKITVEFRLSSEKLSPEDITALLGIQPTRTVNKGDLIKGTIINRKENGWCFSINSEEETSDLGDLIELLVDNLAPYSELIHNVTESCDLESEISCAVYLSEEIPSINFRTELLRKISALNTTIDIDII